MRFIFLALSAFVLILSGCDNQPQVDQQVERSKIVFSNNTDDWFGVSTIKERPNAHSGRTVSVLDSVMVYSLGFEKKIKDACPDKLKSVTFSCWVRYNNPNAKANYVLSIDGDGKNIFWHGVPIKNNPKDTGKWFQVNETVNIPDTVLPENSLKVFVWNISKEEILVDDLSVTFN